MNHLSLIKPAKFRSQLYLKGANVYNSRKHKIHQSHSSKQFYRVCTTEQPPEIEAELAALRPPTHTKIQQKESELIAIIKDKPDQAARLLDTYKKLGVTLNAKIYNMLFAGFAKSPSVPSEKNILKLIDKMRSHGVKPDVSLYTSIISALKSARANANEMVKIFEECCKEHAPDVVTWGAIINALGAVNTDTMLQYLKKMEESGLKPTSPILTSIMRSFADARQVEKVEAMFHKMQEYGIYPTTVSYNTLLNAYAEKGDIEKLMKTYESMTSPFVAPDRVTSNILIKAYGKLGMIDKMMQEYEKMKEKNLGPDRWTFNILRKSLLQHGRKDLFTLYKNEFVTTSRSNTKPSR